MKTIFAFLALILPAAADSLNTANITASVNDVQIYPGSNASHPASIGEKVDLPSSVQTGRLSRAELTFTDKTITRLGQNSVFSFREGGRNLDLKQGSILLQVPKNAGGATIRTATVTAAITGTTVMFEYNPGKWIKLIVLEGTVKLYVKGKKKPVLVPAGSIIIMHPNAADVPEPRIVDIAKILKTSLLIGHGIFGPLPKDATDLIQKTIDQQLIAKNNGVLLPTNYVISGVSKWTIFGVLDSSQHTFFHKECGCRPGKGQ